MPGKPDKAAAFAHEIGRNAYAQAIEALASVLEHRDPYTGQHQKRTAVLSRAIGLAMDLPSDRLDGLALAAKVHDIGKIGVPTEIMIKPGALSAAEWSLIKAHPEVGYDILRHLEMPWPVAEIVLQHHERLDGSGYPRGMRGDDIVLEARILAVADTIDAMMHYRPYRPARRLVECLDQIEGNRGRLYDKAAVAACAKLLRKKGALPS